MLYSREEWKEYLVEAICFWNDFNDLFIQILLLTRARSSFYAVYLKCRNPASCYLLVELAALLKP